MLKKPKKKDSISIIICRGLQLVFIILIRLVIFPPREISAQSLPPSIKKIRHGTEISAQVGEYLLTLSGWTSPFARVYLSSSANNLNAQTEADQNGFFIFSYLFLPYKTGELSLIAEDINGLGSPPLYLPEPANNQDVYIENVLMPPTLSLITAETEQEETNKATGKSFPNSQLKVFLYVNPKTTFWNQLQEKIIKTVFAKTAPLLEVQSNSEGYFEFNLPSTEPAEQKIFVAGLFRPPFPEFGEKELASPKSFTLSFKTLSFWEKIAYILNSLLSQIYLWFKSAAEDPTKIIWLEIPILSFLFIKVLIRGFGEKAKRESSFFCEIPKEKEKLEETNNDSLPRSNI